MTIVTKPLSEKKSEGKGEPLVEDVKVDILPERPASRVNVPFVRTHDFREFGKERRLHSASTSCLFLTALLVMSCGVITGLYLYKQFVRVQMEKFHLRCNIPYGLQRIGEDMDNPDSELLEGEDSYQKYFHEDFEIDDSYEKITVPDFSGGRRSRFIHDFKTNKTGIIDMDGHRCFVMPLNRSLVLPPENLIDLVKKMREGYYEVDTKILRESMQVITPAIEDRANLGHYIQRECYGYPIYRLERYMSGVYKRSAEPEVKFMEFAGKKTHELYIVNYNELEDHKADMPVAMA